MKIIDFVFCDGIRNEIRDKSFMYGIYNDKIVFPKHQIWPVNIPLSIYSRFLIDNKDKKFNRLVFSLEGDPVKNKIELSTPIKEIVHLEKEIPFIINLNMIMEFISPGKLYPKFNFYLDSEKIVGIEPHICIQITTSES